MLFVLFLGEILSEEVVELAGIHVAELELDRRKKRLVEAKGKVGMRVILVDVKGMDRRNGVEGVADTYAFLYYCHLFIALIPLAFKNDDDCGKDKDDAKEEIPKITTDNSDGNSDGCNSPIPIW